MVTGVADQKFNDLAVYPNPFSDRLMLDFKQTIGDLEVEIFDAKGCLVLAKDFGSGRVFELEVEDLPVGIYSVRMVSGGGVFVWRVLRVGI